MRYLLFPLLLCTTTQAALINPLGGSWTDGTTVAEYVEVPPSSGNVSHEYQALLTVADNSHVLSRVRFIGHHPDYTTVWIDNTLDFYDGSGQLDGEFSIEFEDAGGLFFSLNVDKVFKAWLNDTPAIDYRTGIVAPGVYTISWTVDTVALNASKRTQLTWYQIPEPGSVGIIMGLLGLFIFRRIQ